MVRKPSSKFFKNTWFGKLFQRRGKSRGRLRRSVLTLSWNVVAFPFRAFSNFTSHLLQVLQAWWSSRDFHFLLRGLPALFVSFLAAYLMIAALLSTSTMYADTYLLAAREATNKEAFDAARIYYQRAIELDGGSDAARFALARASQQTGDYPRMAAILQLLAPDDGLGHWPAHLWVAKSLLSKSKLTGEEIRSAESQLRKVVRLRPTNANGRILLGELYYNLGVWDKAIEQLEAVRRQVPEKNLMIAKAYSQLGDERAARRHGLAAQEHFRERVEDAPSNFDDLMLLAEATMFVEQYAQAIDLLKNAMALNGDEATKQQLNAAITRTYVAWSDTLLRREDRKDSREQSFQLLCAGLDYNPDEPLLLERLMTYVTPHSEMRHEAKKFLLQNIVDGRAVGASHLLLAIHAFAAEEDLEQAKFHLERAFKLLPQAPLVANNLAWTLGNIEPHDLDRALRIMSPLIEEFPAAYRFRDTRGQILARLERWQDALDDLERCISSMNDNVATHQALAASYEGVGALELAKSHRDVAAQLESQQ
jgi:tetratricopeptide (TPR) repeat protein